MRFCPRTNSLMWSEALNAAVDATGRRLLPKNMSTNYGGGGLISPGTCNYIGYDGENMEVVVQPHAYV